MVFTIIFQSASSGTSSLENVSIEPTYSDVTWMNCIIEKSIKMEAGLEPDMDRITVQAEGSMDNDH